ncbi:hypothetical protein ACWDHH_05235 [Janibacter hoylei]|uniref:hypothetical protein n=1 Tax=Janibacter TaxID=53457 RepID=UPI002238512E|nr:hypothetical protein [Janibacter hoylei]MCW4602791.1 hypothetical protein [Janibacter hoylei]
MSVTTGIVIVAVMAIAYGMGFAVLPMQDWPRQRRSSYTQGGAGLIALLAIVLVLVPWFIPGD